MTTAAEWLALAERARKAKGPDREIDFQVARLSKTMKGFRYDIDWNQIKEVLAIQCDDTDSFSMCSECGRTAAVETIGYFERITASIDAIVALIEREFPGWPRGVTNCYEGTQKPYAHIDTPGGQELNGEASFYGDAETEALAYVAAFCEAKAAQAKENDNG